MNHILKPEFIEIAKDIISAGKSLSEWEKIESDDSFQNGNYTGGFDATEMEFCFSVIEEGKEYWFQLSLDEIGKIGKGEIKSTSIMVTDIKK